MRRVVATFLVASAGGLLAVTAMATTGVPAGEPAPAGFRLADGSAGCFLAEDDELACRTAGLDASVVLARDGSSRVSRTPVEWNRDTPLLGAAELWWHAGFVCRVRHGRVHCAAGGGSIAAGHAHIGGVR